MTTTITTAQFALQMALQGQMIDREIQEALRESGTIVRDEAKRVLGTYDYGWPALSPVTVARKGGRDEPGIDTREMHDSVNFQVETGAVQIGTDEEKAVWFELGTSRQPPRSFLAQALVHKTPEVLAVFAKKLHGVVLP